MAMLQGAADGGDVGDGDDVASCRWWCLLMLDGGSKVVLDTEVVVGFFLGFKSNIYVFLSFPFIFSYLTIFFYVDCQKTLTKGLTSLTE